jgi:hypothetical protein
MTTWHPILEVREPIPGHWQLHDGVQRLYGDIRLVKRGGELGYRADRVHKDGSVELVGYYMSLRVSCEKVHAAFIRSHGAPPRTSYGA